MSNTQEQRILNYFKTRASLDRIRSITKLGIIELPARICDLQRKGHRFTKIRKEAINRFGESFSYTLYFYAGRRKS